MAVKRRIISTLLAVGLSLVFAGCATTRFYEREKLANPAMTLDADRRLEFVLNKVQAARGGSFGGFGGAAAGGCGCQ
ncbi:MAG: hypothetical protein ACI9WU_000481 [Myxococcota bacterium]